MSGKGSKQRPTNKVKYNENFDRIFQSNQKGKTNDTDERDTKGQAQRK